MAEVVIKFMNNEMASNETSPMLQRTPAHKQLKRVFSRYEFENEELERLYTRYVFKLQQASFGHLLCLASMISACLSVVNFVYVRNLSVPGIYFGIQFFTFVFLFVFINTRFMKESHFPVICLVSLIFLIGFTVFGFPLDFGSVLSERPTPIHTPVQGVWEVMFVVFLIYSMMPLRTYLTAILGIILPVSHMIVSALVANSLPPLLWRQVSLVFFSFIQKHFAELVCLHVFHRKI